MKWWSNQSLSEVDVNVILSVLDRNTYWWTSGPSSAGPCLSIFILFNNIKRTLFTVYRPLYYLPCYIKVTLLPALALNLGTENQRYYAKICKWDLIPREHDFMDIFPWNLMQTLMVPRGYPVNFKNPVTFCCHQYKYFLVSIIVNNYCMSDTIILWGVMNIAACRGQTVGPHQYLSNWTKTCY